MDHGGEYPDTCRKQSSSSTPRPILHLRADHENGKVVDSQGFMLDTEDE